MMKARNEFIKNLRYLCLVGIIALGLITIVGSNGGDGGGDGGGNDGDDGGCCYLEINEDYVKTETHHYSVTVTLGATDCTWKVRLIAACSEPCIAECLINGEVVAQDYDITSYGEFTEGGPEVHSGDAVQTRCSEGYLVDGSQIAIWHYGNCEAQVLFDSDAKTEPPSII